MGTADEASFLNDGRDRDHEGAPVLRVMLAQRPPPSHRCGRAATGSALPAKCRATCMLPKSATHPMRASASKDGNFIEFPCSLTVRIAEKDGGRVSSSNRHMLFILTRESARLRIWLEEYDGAGVERTCYAVQQMVSPRSDHY